MSDELKLLPCPFCNGAAKVIRIKPHDRYWDVECQGSTWCRATMRNFRSAEHAVRIWNRRPTPDAKLREALERLIGEIVAGEEHGDGADDDACPICAAIKFAQAALASPSEQKPSD